MNPVPDIKIYQKRGECGVAFDKVQRIVGHDIYAIKGNDWNWRGFYILFLDKQEIIKVTTDSVLQCRGFYDFSLRIFIKFFCLFD